MQTMVKAVFLITFCFSLLSLAPDQANAAAILSFTKLVNGVDANEAEDAPVIAPGDLVTWTYEVTNTGNALDESFEFDTMSILDDNGTSDVIDDFAPIIGLLELEDDTILEPGETWIYEASATAVEGGALNTAILTAISMDTQTTIQLSDIGIYRDPNDLEVPEPSTLALFVIALGGLGFLARRRLTV